MKQRVAIRFCVILKKTAIATFETMKSAYGEVCLSRIRCLNGMNIQRRARVVTRR
jgi:hypothetical protein